MHLITVSEEIVLYSQVQIHAIFHKKGKDKGKKGKKKGKHLKI